MLKLETLQKTLRVKALKVKFICSFAHTSCVGSVVNVHDFDMHIKFAPNSCIMYCSVLTAGKLYHAYAPLHVWQQLTCFVPQEQRCHYILYAPSG